jgi:very-short-patch-repair endonuclease
VADLISVRKGTENWQSHFNRISSKHVDFVLLEPQSLRPLLAIELDDKSHDAANRRERDAFVNEALAAAQMPFLRIKAARTYSPADLWAQVEAAMRTTGPAMTSSPAS